MTLPDGRPDVTTASVPPSPTSPRVAILSGGGALPLLIADSAAARGCDVHIVAIRGAADLTIERYPHTWVDFGEIGRMTSALRGPAARHGLGVVVIAGSVKRPDLMRLKPDAGLFRSLPELLRIVTAGGDDALLSRVIAFFERRGLVVVGAHDIAPELVLGQGPVGRHDMTAQACMDATLAQVVLAAIGDLDVGQAIVVENGRIAAIEGIEGTDRMLARAATRPARGHATLLKAPKPNQERRVDLPTIGPATIDAAAQAGIGGIAVLAGETLGLDRPGLVARADAAGMFVVGIQPDRAAAQSPRARTIGPEMLHTIGLVAPRAADRIDAALAAEAAQRLAPFDTGRAAATVRGHVLGIAAAEGPDAMIARIAVHPQWGLSRFRRRRGACAVRLEQPPHSDASWPDRLDAIANAGFAAAVLVGIDAHHVPPAWIDAADRLQLALLACRPDAATSSSGVATPPGAPA